jgi:2-methylaconitate cis-trans-isomerase PrpF
MAGDGRHLHRSACKLPGTVAEGSPGVTDAAREEVVIEHPTGTMEAVITTGRDPAGAPTVLAGGTLRTRAQLMRGEVYIPARVWPGPRR